MEVLISLHEVLSGGVILNKRPTLVITFSILDILHRFGRMNVSRLCLYTGLSYSKLMTHINSLLKAGLVEELMDGGREYVLTQGGVETLIKLRKYVESLSNVGLIEYDGY